MVVRSLLRPLPSALCPFNPTKQNMNGLHALAIVPWLFACARVYGLICRYYSTNGDGLHLGALVVRDLSGQLQSGCRALSVITDPVCALSLAILQVNLFVGGTGLYQLGRIYQCVVEFMVVVCRGAH